MAQQWIPIRTDLPHDSRIEVMAEKLGIDKRQVFWYVMEFWLWCGKNCRNDGTPKAPISTDFIDREIMKGFADALAKVGWLEFKGDSFVIPKFEKYLGRVGASAARQQRYRDSQSAKRQDGQDSGPALQGGPPSGQSIGSFTGQPRRKRKGEGE